MSLPREIKELLDTSNFDAIEELWLARMGENPTDFRYFAAIARALNSAGDGERAQFLLEMLDDQISGEGLWRERLALLQQTGQLRFPSKSRLHREILASLEHIHGHHSSYAAMVDKVGLHKAPEDIVKTWQKADRLDTILTYDIGSIVAMKDKGAGRIVELNMALESFKIDFERHPGLLVGFRAAGKLLELLPSGHLLRRKFEEPKALEELRDSDPSQLLRLLLESYNGPRTGAEIRQDLHGLILDERWNSWWASARKHPQVVVEGKGRRAYSWANSSEDAKDAAWEAFEKASETGRLDLLRREGARDEELKKRMSKALFKTASEVVESDPGLACEIYFAIDKHGELPENQPWSPETLISAPGDLQGLLSGIKDRSRRERAYDLARRKRRDWPEVFAKAIWQENESRALNNLSEGLEREAPELFDAFYEQLLSQPRKAPAAFAWLVERSRDNESLLSRHPMRMFKQILWALASEDFAAYRSRLAAQCESGGTLPRLIPHLNEEQAAQASEAVEKAAGLADYQRQPLLNGIDLKFPALRKDAEVPLYATLDMIDSKRVELKTLAEVEIPANRQAIEEARAMGDLRENFEYKSARQRHEYLSARAAALSHDLARVRPIDASQISGEEVVIGCKISLESTESRRVITILGPWNSDPDNHVLSNESELAQLLLGNKLGEHVEIAGTSYKIARIEPYA